MGLGCDPSIPQRPKRAELVSRVDILRLRTYRLCFGVFNASTCVCPMSKAQQLTLNLLCFFIFGLIVVLSELLICNSRPRCLRRQSLPDPWRQAPARWGMDGSLLAAIHLFSSDFCAEDTCRQPPPFYIMKAQGAAYLCPPSSEGT